MVSARALPQTNPVLDTMLVHAYVPRTLKVTLPTVSVLVKVAGVPEDSAVLVTVDIAAVAGILPLFSCQVIVGVGNP